MIDYETEFNLFMEEKNIKVEEERSRDGTVKGFVKWLMLNQKEINIDGIREWGDAYKQGG